MRPSVALLALALAPHAAHPADSEVEIHGVRTGAGPVRAALFASARDFDLGLQLRASVSDSGDISTGIFTRESDFPHPPQESAELAASSKTLQVRFTDVEPGVYALAVYQDRNSDNRLDMTFKGMPLEPWGMSNDPRPADRPPTWDEAKFTLPPEGIRLRIDLRQ
jgi:uncharacterized protein (DUF2141 family)